MITQEMRIKAFFDDLDDILRKRYCAAGEALDHDRKTNATESEILRQIRIRLARFRQGH